MFLRVAFIGKGGTSQPMSYLPPTCWRRCLELCTTQLMTYKPRTLHNRLLPMSLPNLPNVPKYANKRDLPLSEPLSIATYHCGVHMSFRLGRDFLKRQKVSNGSTSKDWVSNKVTANRFFFFCITVMYTWTLTDLDSVEASLKLIQGPRGVLGYGLRERSLSTIRVHT